MISKSNTNTVPNSVTVQTSSATRDLTHIQQNKFYWISNRYGVAELSALLPLALLVTCDELTLWRAAWYRFVSMEYRKKSLQYRYCMMCNFCWISNNRSRVASISTDILVQYWVWYGSLAKVGRGKCYAVNFSQTAFITNQFSSTMSGFLGLRFPLHAHHLSGQSTQKAGPQLAHVLGGS